MIQLPRSKAKLVRQVITQWQESNSINPEKAIQLHDSIEPIWFDWQRASKHLFRIAAICMVISVISLFGSDWFKDIITALFSAPAEAYMVITAIMAAAFYYTGHRRQKTKPQRRYSNEAILFLGVASTAASIAAFGAAFGNDSGHFSILLLMGCIIYGCVAWLVKSPMIWVFALLSFGSWFGAETGYASGWGAYYLGMDYPMRFALLGFAMLTSALLIPTSYWRDFQHSTKVIGALYLFIALWILSIFGSIDRTTSWTRSEPLELFLWSFLFFATALAALLYGLRYDDRTLKGFGLTFIGINLYTKFFEHLWHDLHKALFFALLGGSLWLIASKFEKIWNIQLPNKQVIS